MLNDFIKTTYEITPFTLAILPKRENKGSTNSHILEEKHEYIVHKTPTKVIDRACKYFGSSLKGRIEGTFDVSNITHKPPVAIDPATGMYFFPTTSPKNNKCSWIAHSHIDSIKSTDTQQTEIVFKNGKKILLDVSHGSILNQIQRTAQFRYLLEDRIQLIRNDK